MDKLIAGFANQMAEAIEIGKTVKLTVNPKGIQQLVVSGLGGSGIGADFIKDFVAADLKIPFIVSKDYSLPGFVNENTLVIISSYSGNTEETLSSFEQALNRKARIVCITSGGKVAEMAIKNKLDLILIPGGMPPRSCMGYSSIQQLFILKNLKLITNSFQKQLAEAIELLNTDEHRIIAEAKRITEKIWDKTPVIYAVNGTEAVAVRFRQQINENAKLLCWHHVVPEMNHNELVGWAGANHRFAVIIIHNEHDNERSKLRLALNKRIFTKYTPTIVEIHSRGNSWLAKNFFLIHLTDWVSWYLSVKLRVDCTEVKVIDWLKGELGKQ